MTDYVRDDIEVQIAAVQAVIDNWNEQRWVRAVQAHAEAAWPRGYNDPAYV